MKKKLFALALGMVLFGGVGTVALAHSSFDSYPSTYHGGIGNIAGELELTDYRTVSGYTRLSNTVNSKIPYVYMQGKTSSGQNAGAVDKTGPKTSHGGTSSVTRPGYKNTRATYFWSTHRASGYTTSGNCQLSVS